jgi:electron transfer flavoprotein alpha/beta subunit
LKLSGPILVLTGDVSSDESHGSFGAFLAQALGLDFAHRATDLQPTATGWLTHVKLERGYRQELELEGSAVVTVAASGLKLPEADWPAWLASRTAAIPSVDVDPAEGKAPGPATVTVLRRPLPRVKRYSVPSSSLSAEARIRTLVGGKLQGSGVTLPASQGVARQVDATLTLLKSRGHLAAGPT